MYAANKNELLAGCESGCEDDSSLTSLLLRLIDDVNSEHNVKSLGEIALTVNDAFDSKAEQRASTYRFLLCVKKKQRSIEDGMGSGEESDEFGQDHMMRRLLSAVQRCDDDLTTIILCRLLRGYATQCSSSASHRRQRRLLRLDAPNYVIRSLVSYLKDSDPVPLHCVAIDALIGVLFVISSRDRKFSLKVRLGGLIEALYPRLFAKGDACSLTQLRLICRCIRSPRNAQLLGRSRDFASRLVARLDEPAGAVFEQTRVMKTARYAEILYFTCKNKKCKTALIDEKVLPVVKKLYEKHFELRGADAAHLELCLISVACFRQLSKTKRGREELIALGALEMCENSIRVVTEDRHALQNHSPLIGPLLQLQDSLCALCIRCLPVQPFPITPGASLPVSFSLPQLHIPSIRSSASKSLLKSKRLAATPATVDNGDDNAPSSDDEGGDEEEESFAGIGILDEHASDDDDDARLEAPLSVIKPLYFSRQKHTELCANYARLFVEYAEGRRRSSTLSGLRGRPLSYEKIFYSKAQQVKSVIRFVKVAFPELADPSTEMEAQPLQQNDDSMREMVVQEMARSRLNGGYTPRIVYDLDQLLLSKSNVSSKEPLKNVDKNRIGKIDENCDHLMFESRFESGNLRRATQIAERNYELILSPDINQSRAHFQWFYFEVSNNKANVPYTFEVINCLKNTSMFSHGMQPVVFSVSEYFANRCGWVRAGSSICYYRNLYSNPVGVSSNGASKKARSLKGKKALSSESRNFFSLRFNLTFRHAADVCYVAYHFPFTYSYLQASLECALARSNSGAQKGAHLRNERLCHSLGGNAVPIVTITAGGSKAEMERREVVLLTARVHPGESNASWMIQGAIDFLLSQAPTAVELRERFVFKIVPMLNPDGVINGSHRCSLAGVDLNRVWDCPNETLHPTIYHSKGVVQFLVEVIGKKPFLVIDFHGHSRRPNIFMYGNNPEESWRQADHSLSHSNDFLYLPELLDQTSKTFSLAGCRFNITKSKEPSARVVVWRQFGVSRVYTIEASYCGFDSGPYVGNHIGIAELKEMGRDICEALLPLKNIVDVNLEVESSVGETARRAKSVRSSRRRASGSAGCTRKSESSCDCAGSS